LHPDVVACTLKRFEEELEKALATRSQGDADLRRQPGEIERGIANQLRALRDGYSPAITGRTWRNSNTSSPALKRASRLRILEPSSRKFATRGVLSNRGSKI
jgi:hypothetical protein